MVGHVLVAWKAVASVHELSVRRLALQALTISPCQISAPAVSEVLRSFGRGSVGGLLGIAFLGRKSWPQQADEHSDRDTEG